MKIVAIIPYWQGYTYPDRSIGNRDALKIGGHSLIEKTVRIAQNIAHVCEIVIYTSNDNVQELLGDSLKYKVQIRDKNLDDQSVSIEDIIERFLLTSDGDIFVLMHPRCPFLKTSSINECVEKVVGEGFDSAFIAFCHRKLAWFAGKPLNYSLAIGENTQKLSSVEPVILESSSVYVFTRKLFEKTRRRIGENPYMKFVGRFEGFEIDSFDDYEIADLIVNAGLDILEG